MPGRLWRKARRRIILRLVAYVAVWWGLQALA